jgi:hypothetical protein
MAQPTAHDDHPSGTRNAAPPPIVPPPLSSESASFEGVAHSVRTGRDTDGSGRPVETLTLHLERVDEDGRALTPMTVELRGASLRGVPPPDGSRVRVHGRVGPHGDVHADRVVDLGTGASVTVPGLPLWRKIAVAAVVLFVIATAAVVAWAYLAAGDSVRL